MTGFATLLLCKLPIEGGAVYYSYLLAKVRSFFRKVCMLLLPPASQGVMYCIESLSAQLESNDSCFFALLFSTLDRFVNGFFVDPTKTAAVCSASLTHGTTAIQATLVVNR